jgi:hypothetical protein
VYQGRERPMTMASWIVVPEAFYDDLEGFGAWTQRAHALAPSKAPARRAARSPAKPAAAEPKSTAPKSTLKAKAKAKPKPTARRSQPGSPRKRPASRGVRRRARAT